VQRAHQSGRTRTECLRTGLVGLAHPAAKVCSMQSGQSAQSRWFEAARTQCV
jgi:hypothetical protein